MEKPDETEHMAVMVLTAKTVLLDKMVEMALLVVMA
jgi:hypothetical protein